MPNMEPYLEEGSLDGTCKDTQGPTSSCMEESSPSVRVEADCVEFSVDSTDNREPDTLESGAGGGGGDEPPKEVVQSTHLHEMADLDPSIQTPAVALESSSNGAVADESPLLPEPHSCPVATETPHSDSSTQVVVVNDSSPVMADSVCLNEKCTDAAAAYAAADHQEPAESMSSGEAETDKAGPSYLGQVFSEDASVMSSALDPGAEAPSAEQQQQEHQQQQEEEQYVETFGAAADMFLEQAEQRVKSGEARFEQQEQEVTTNHFDYSAMVTEQLSGAGGVQECLVDEQQQHHYQDMDKVEQQQAATVCEADSSAEQMYHHHQGGASVYVVDDGGMSLSAMQNAASMAPYENPEGAMLVEMAPMATDGAYAVNSHTQVRYVDAGLTCEPDQDGMISDAQAAELLMRVSEQRPLSLQDRSSVPYVQVGGYAFLLFQDSTTT